MVSLSGLQLTERNLILTGYSEPNKPRIGRQVADRLGMRFVDVEERIEQITGENLSELRRAYGERRVKAAEADIMDEMILYRNSVIRISGSTLAHSNHYERIAETGVVLCLVARLDAILRRIHLTLGARYHDPRVRGTELGMLRREWEIRQKPGLQELDVTDLDDDGIVLALCEFWQRVAIRRT
jgi:shikimate kinase